MQEVIKSFVQNIFEEKLDKFSVLFLRWVTTQSIQAKRRFSSFNSGLLPCHSTVFTETFVFTKIIWKQIGCNTPDIYTVQRFEKPRCLDYETHSFQMSQIAEDTFVTSLHCETTWHAFMTSGLYGYQSPRCFMVFIYLTSPNCNTKSLFCWFLGEASAQPPMLLY